MRRLDARKDHMRTLLESLKDDLSVGRIERVRHALGHRAEVNTHVRNVYFGFLWMRFALAMLACSLLCFALVSGLLVDFLVTAVQVSSDGCSGHGTRSRFVVWFMFIWLPVITILAALFINESIALFFDSLGAAPMALTRAKAMVAMGALPHVPPSRRLCFFTDLAVLVWLEVIPVAWMFYLRYCHDIHWWVGYVSGLLVSTVLGAVGLSLIDLRVATKTGGGLPQRFEDNMLVATEMLHETIQMVRIRPSVRPYSGLRGKHQAFVLSMTPAEAEYRHDLMLSRLKPQWRDRPEVSRQRDRQLCLGRCGQSLRSRFNQCSEQLPVMSAARLWLFAVCVGLLWMVICGILFALCAVPVSLQATGVLLFLTVIGLAVGVQHTLSTNGTSFPIVVLVLIGLQESLIYITVGQQIKESHQLPLMQPSHGLADMGIEFGLPTIWKNDPDVVPYPICRMTWGAPGPELTVLDMAAVAWFSYEPECPRIQPLLREAFAGTGKNPTVEFCSDYNHSLPRSISVYFPGEPGLNGTRVVALKGTSTKMDVYADVALYGAVQLMQWFSAVTVPLLSLLPVSMIEHLIWVQHAGSYFWPPDELVQNLTRLEYYLDLPRGVEHPTATTAVLTGHSLGGGLAAVVSGRLGLDSVVFSAPGNEFTRKIFGLDSQKSQKYVNVIPDNDVVPRVDEHEGVVQRILCRDAKGREESATVCHRLGKTVCELWRLCGDPPYHRNFTAACADYLGPKHLGKEYHENHAQWEPGR